MTERLKNEYQILLIAEVTAHASGDLAVLVLDSDQGRIALHMQRELFGRLEHDIRQALAREEPPAPLP